MLLRIVFRCHWFGLAIVMYIETLRAALKNKIYPERVRWGRLSRKMTMIYEK